MDFSTQQYWGLAVPASPATHGVGTGYFGPRHEEALARLQYAVDSGLRCVRLQGERGVGKSFLLQHFAGGLPTDRIPVARLDGAAGDLREFLLDLAVELGLSPEQDLAPPALWRRVVDRLHGLSRSREAIVLVIDSCEPMPAEAVAVLTRLIRMETVRLTVVVAVAEDEAPLDDETADDPLRELSDLTAELPPLQVDEIAPFLAAGWRRSADLPPLATADGCAALHALTGGLPRRIHQLLPICLTAGMALELEQIASELVHQVAADLMGRRPRGSRPPQSRAA